MIIRDIKTEDWEELRDLLYDLVHEKPPVAIELEPLIMKGKEWIAQFPRGNLGKFVMAENNGTAVGFCYVAVPSYYKPMSFIGIAVAKSHRRDGLASQLFYEVAQWAVKARLQYILADVWEWNKDSIKFFEHLGFIEKSRFEDKFKGEMKVKIRLVKEL